MDDVNRKYVKRIVFGGFCSKRTWISQQFEESGVQQTSRPG